MRKKLLFRLCLILMVTFAISSCRTDQFPEQEKYNNSSKFQLTSKRISLNESKHKSSLFPELEKAKAGIKTFTENNLQGKGTYYGNDFIIDTDDVIYIENGPNYHTYTFRITRSNAPANAPVENLLLTPLPDGTYKEFLVRYNLTESERVKILNDEFVDTKNKTEIVELSTGNASNILGKYQSCSYETVTISVSCASGDHMPGQKGCTLTGNNRAKSYSMVALVCTGVDDGGGGGGGPISGPGSGGGGGEPCTDCPPGHPSEPCTAPEVPTGPLEPSLDPSIGGGCGSGIPTQSNLPLPDRTTPCEKTKKVLENTEVQTNVNTLKEQSKIKDDQPNYGEKAFKLNADGSAVSPIIVGDEHSAELGYVENYTSFYHNHTPKGIKIHSPPDIYMLFKFIAAQPVGTSVSTSFGGMVGSNECASGCPDGYEYSNFIIRFGGTYDEAIAIKNRNYTKADLDNLMDEFGKFERKLRNKSGYSSQNGNFLSFKGLEELFFNALDEMNIDKNKIILQRIDKNGTVYNVTLDASGKPIETPCP
ncbi:hypothetical protein ACFQO9_10830 [Chryseobacterium zhengzhouense]|uniref:Uncharacterized protein n=1 Tax=Chryseobacterium zhengzhouense TaxID=1636086 RepID=A0ABW2LX93_9FLAO